MNSLDLRWDGEDLDCPAPSIEMGALDPSVQIPADETLSPACREAGLTLESTLSDGTRQSAALRLPLSIGDEAGCLSMTTSQE